MIDTIENPPDAFAYLVHQRGSIWKWREWPAEWRRRYIEQLKETYGLIKPHLPETHYLHVLDVGCGMGGIDLALYGHYGGGASFALIDGCADAGPVLNHGKPSSDVNRAACFLIDNGVPEGQLQTFIAPDCELWESDPIDLVISLQAWCFHFPPSAYLDHILERARPKCRFILDVRSSKPEWRWELEKALGSYERIAQLKKSELLVFAR